ncbi:MAG: aspartate aminotransferase family protein, partial [Actinomycetota bacterium]
MSPSMDTSNEAWFARAQAVIPGGVDSPVRSFSSVGGTPFTVASGSGGTVTDVEGKTYIDLVQSYGASLLG